MKDKAQKIVVTNVYSYENKGDAAIVLSLVSEIKRVFPKAEIVLLSTDAKGDMNKYDTAVAPSLMWILFSSLKDLPVIYAGFQFIMRFTGLLIFLAFRAFTSINPKYILHKDIRANIEIIESASLVIACGGGYLGNANKHPRTLLLLSGMCLSFLSAHYLRKRVYLYSQSIGPLEGFIARFIVGFSLKRVDLIEAREAISYEFVKNIGLQDKLVLTADAALLLKKAPDT